MQCRFSVWERIPVRKVCTYLTMVGCCESSADDFGVWFMIISVVLGSMVASMRSPDRSLWSAL